MYLPPSQYTPALSSLRLPAPAAAAATRTTSSTRLSAPAAAPTAAPISSLSAGTKRPFALITPDTVSQPELPSTFEDPPVEHLQSDDDVEPGAIKPTVFTGTRSGSDGKDVAEERLVDGAAELSVAFLRRRY